MGIFGWSYPPGCESVPGDEDRGCEVCLQSEDACVCPPCDVCGEHGRGECYVDRSLEGLSFEGCHGMGLTPEQKAAINRGQTRMREADQVLDRRLWGGGRRVGDRPGDLDEWADLVNRMCETTEGAIVSAQRRLMFRLCLFYALGAASGALGVLLFAGPPW